MPIDINEAEALMHLGWPHHHFDLVADGRFNETEALMHLGCDLVDEVQDRVRRASMRPRR